tara:strand:+ start:383 stop:556 length:174 start_codon:yes stop_codon:yes gene_type:complete
MIPPTDVERRNRLAYLALYCAIQGDGVQSEQIRHMVRLFDENTEVSQMPAVAELVSV